MSRVLFVARAAGKPFAIAAISIGFALALFASPAQAVEVPIASCQSPGYGCSSSLPVYDGPGPANWEAAIQLSCSRFAASHRGNGFCPCDGTICSVVTACEVVSAVPGPASIGANGIISQMRLEAFIPAVGVSVDYGQRASAQCNCPFNSGFNAAGRCVCNGTGEWNGTFCQAPSACTVGKYLDTCGSSVVGRGRRRGTVELTFCPRQPRPCGGS